jgi:hypothetical protein
MHTIHQNQNNVIKHQILHVLVLMEGTIALKQSFKLFLSPAFCQFLQFFNLCIMVDGTVHSNWKSLLF